MFRPIAFPLAAQATQRQALAVLTQSRHHLRAKDQRVGGNESQDCFACAAYLEVDWSAGWSNVGGLRAEVDALKECAMHPLIYAELYDSLGVTPPKGTLLHGPPGVGSIALLMLVYLAVMAPSHGPLR